ncbi:MAG: ribosome maturation factor RimM [Peptoniphilus sp.]|nr:ribosome maturation factor RimM [Peptoniphilus sp.]MDD7363364.1 ribosome maturation factor RimM [Bacillota bacterium]MDY6044283.1 ribosome maturation factor RimM [Peptoniphilus sp.]
MSEKTKVLVGKITSAHGIKGMVKVYPLTDTPERLAEIKRIFLEGEDDLRSIESASVQKSMVLMKIEGIDTRNASERLRNVEMYIPIEDRKPLEDGQFFIDDLIGLEVFDTSGNAIGAASDVLTEHGNDILVVRDGEREFLVPFVKAFIKDVTDERIVIDPIEGLLS